MTINTTKNGPFCKAFSACREGRPVRAAVLLFSGPRPPPPPPEIRGSS